MTMNWHDLWVWTAIDLVAGLGSMAVLKFIGFPVGRGGNKKALKYLKDEPIGALFSGAILAPVIEELIFRGIPMMFCALMVWIGLWNHNPHWIFATIVSLVFAAIHGLEDDAGNFVLPVPQFIGGMIFWYVAYRWNVWSSIWVHACSNFAIIMISIIGVSFKK